jgi:hypothetical protein
MERKGPLKRILWLKQILLRVLPIQLDSLNLVWALQDRLLPFPIYLPCRLLSRLLFQLLPIKDFLNLEFRILHLHLHKILHRMWIWTMSCIMLRQMVRQMVRRMVENGAIAVVAIDANPFYDNSF